MYTSIICKYSSLYVDINECETGEQMCFDRNLCTNTEGNYNCSCPDGYNKVGERGCSGRLTLCTHI